ncbi:MAG: glycosyltransferase [Phycisphaeraceae bacterium]
MDQPSRASPYVVVSSLVGPGGAPRHTADMIRALVAADHPVSIIETRNAVLAPLLADLNISCTHLPLPEDGTAQSLFTAWRRALKPYRGARAQRTHRLILPRCAGGCSLAILLALRSLFPRLYTIEHTMPDVLHHGGWRPVPDLQRRRSLGWRGKRWLEAHCLHRSIAVCQAVRDAVIQTYALPADLVRACPNWVDVERFVPDDEAGRAIRRQLGLAPEAFVVGYLGRLSREKRLDLLVRGFVAFAAAQHRPVALLLVGNGPLEQALHKLVAQLGAGELVHFVPWIDNAPAWYNAMDLLALTSATEGLPLVVLEAMACGRLVLAPPVGGVRECLDDQVSGFVVAMDQPEQVAAALTAIAALPQARREEIAVAARAIAFARFRPQVALAQLLTALDAIPAARRAAQALAPIDRKVIHTESRA